jgi:hypothetical protein
LQDDFVNEKPDIQHHLEGRGHVCIFYPKFHCEINPIEMLWGYMKYCAFSLLEPQTYTYCLPRFLCSNRWQVRDSQDTGTSMS